MAIALSEIIKNLLSQDLCHVTVYTLKKSTPKLLYSVSDSSPEPQSLWPLLVKDFIPSECFAKKCSGPLSANATFKNMFQDAAWFLSHDILSLFVLPAVKEMYDYQGRSYLHVPQDVGINLRSADVPDKCYLPKKQIHVWTGHTKVSHKHLCVIVCVNVSLSTSWGILQ